MRKLESKGFMVVTIEGKIIDDFYPNSEDEENSKKEIKQEIWERSTFKQNKNK